MSKSRENAFTRHPDGAKILQRLLDKKITQKEASRLLGCSEANVSQLMGKYKHVPTKEERREEVAMSTIEKQFEDLGLLSVQLDTRISPEKYTAVAWQVILQSLMIIRETNLDPELFLKFSTQISKMLQFQMKEQIFPDIGKHFEITKEELQEAIDEAVKEVIDDHDNWCKYLKEYDKRIAREQNKQRLASQESTHLG